MENNLHVIEEVPKRKRFHLPRPQIKLAVSTPLAVGLLLGAGMISLGCALISVPGVGLICGGVFLTGLSLLLVDADRADR